MTACASFRRLASSRASLLSDCKRSSTSESEIGFVSGWVDTADVTVNCGHRRARSGNFRYLNNCYLCIAIVICGSLKNERLSAAPTFFIISPSDVSDSDSPRSIVVLLSATELRL